MPRDYFDATDGSIRANGCLGVCVKARRFGVAMGVELEKRTTVERDVIDGCKFFPGW